jgi:hypothetical protein
MPQVLNNLRQAAIIQSTESSNRFEGIVVEKKRLKSLLEKGSPPESRSEAEVIGYKNVLARIHTANDRIEIMPETILKIHSDILSRTDLPAGAWKQRDNMLEEHLPDGRWVTRYVPVSACEIPFI